MGTGPNSRKANQIRNNPNVVISFPAKEPNTWYKVEGEASEASWEEVKTKWKWWLLEWVPEGERKPLLSDNARACSQNIITFKPFS